ncbi:MAG: AAA family ATPase, partial [Oscillospiraceae bacterium]|nr:AAA family ATPase [Oscillospiraceae bacterium]
LIDLDPQANMSAYLGYEDNGSPNINNMMMTAVRGGDVPDGILHNEKNNVDYIPSDLNLSSAEFYLSQALARESVLKRILSADRFEGYDYVIVDCLASLGILTMNAFTAADGVIIPVQTQKFALDVVEGITDVIKQIQATVNPKLEILGILPTMLTNTVMTRETMDTLSEKYSEILTKTHINHSVEAAYSAQKQTSLCLGNSKLGEEYKALATEVLMRYGG